MQAMRPLTLALLLAVLGTSFADDSLKTTKVYGGRHWHPQSPKDYVRTYVRMPKDYDDTTMPAAVGVEMTRGFVSKSNSLVDPPMEGKPPNPMYVPIPNGDGTSFNYTSYEGNLMFPQNVGYQPFKFFYWGYNYHGHPPMPYAVPHYDLHFMFEEYDYWQKEWNPATSMGPCLGASPATFEKIFTAVPETCFPGGKSGAITNIGNVNYMMGSHLVNLAGEEWTPAPKPFDWAQIYGQYDGRTAFFEPMVSTKYMMSSPGSKRCIDISATMPLAMPKAMALPTQLCFEAYKSHWQVEYRKFKMVPGDCEGSEGYQGLYPVGSPIAEPVPEGCPIPKAP
ncbi:hypothetical protein HYH03_000816 [Edaphochlamys debaryana]|uniref:DUF1996 domain-containing protein n=1 Tax=Edaphochlamys debaryana TaxID=47281 RepID=A0A836C6J4_9CHLO|nr:hypothetical protein HYH03_000816 [Edaphochlamys debaryana]|eukprot:KAG2500994.1 hypothetical protein HYH03_000816 [Edaphochlamys debaryana]